MTLFNYLFFENVNQRHNVLALSTTLVTLGGLEEMGCSMYEWVDKTSYSQGESPRVPRTWEISLGGGFRVVVTRHRHLNPEAWYMLCYELRIDEHTELEQRDIKLAQFEALARIAGKLDAMSAKTKDALAVSLERYEADPANRAV